MLLLTGMLTAALPAEGAEEFISALKHELRRQLSPPFSEAHRPVLDWAGLREFYGPRGFYPAWVDHAGPRPIAEILRHTLQAAAQEGLEPKAYHPELIATLWSARSTTRLARLELLLTDAYFRYSTHLHTGRHSPEIDYYWDIVGPDFDAVAWLRYLLTVDNFQTELQGLAPMHAGYVRLRESLNHYQQIRSQGGWPTLPAGPLLKLGSWHEQVKLLRARLRTEGDLQMGPVISEQHFDQAVKFAVERFQVRHGLKMDGRVGPLTRAAMNVPVTQRIEQIKFNMDRWRWLPESLGRRYIIVNTAGFTLMAVDKEDIRFDMGVIIGTPARPTPVISGQLHTVVFNPYWTVPQTIIFEDLIPQQQRAPGYLQAKGIRVFDHHNPGQELDPTTIDWQQVSRDHFPYLLRQDPGPTNPLGRIKFLFSNRYDVYLHDTPTRQLFHQTSRALSSGCIRVQDPLQLANYLFAGQGDWTAEKIEAVMESGTHQEVPLAESMPIYLVYLTAWVGANRGVHFRQDIYQRDPQRPNCDEVR